jgi:putative aminopeptidase FrvX
LYNKAEVEALGVHVGCVIITYQIHLAILNGNKFVLVEQIDNRIEAL